jgi:hypothetical protein
MSELVNRVVDAMTNAMNSEKCDSHATSRAAIKAVAEYLQSRPHDVNLVYWLGGVLLLDQLDERS